MNALGFGELESNVIGVGFKKVDILEVRSWRSPVSHYNEEEVGTARIRRIEYEPGIYFMEGVAGYDFFHIFNPIKITVLEIKNVDWDTAMVDDPLHTFGMLGLANACRGKVLVAGLGLGLVIHFLALNDKVDEIHVVEINKDVIALVGKYLGRYDKVEIINDDFKQYLRYNIPIETYDYAILDLWSVSSGDSQEYRKKVVNEMAELYLETYFIADKVYIWGMREPDRNPAVRKIVDTELLEIVRREIYEAQRR